jgi:hypothetical protein
MWRNPKYQAEAEDQSQEAPPDQAGPPVEQGERLATFPRSDRQGGESELRVDLSRYQGHPYVSVRLWTQDRITGDWWPTRKGVSVRLSEADGVAEALVQAVRLADAGRQPPPTPTRKANSSPAGSSRRQRQPARGPELFKDDGGPGQSAGDDFDEFG